MPTQAPRRLLDQAQTRITKAARTTLARYLEKARQAIIHGHPPTHTADASPSDLPPNLEAWPDSQVWAQLVEQHLAPAIGVAFDEAFHAAACSDQLNIHQHRQAFMEQVYDRLSLGLWGDGVFERIRTDLAQAVDAGESIPAMQARISDELQVDKHSYLAERIARTEAHAATEGGTWSSQRAWQEATGQQLHHQWIAASDERTRPTHAAPLLGIRPYCPRDLRDSILLWISMSTVLPSAFSSWAFLSAGATSPGLVTVMPTAPMPSASLA